MAVKIASQGLQSLPVRANAEGADARHVGALGFGPRVGGARPRGSIREERGGYRRAARPVQRRNRDAVARIAADRTVAPIGGLHHPESVRSSKEGRAAVEQTI